MRNRVSIAMTILLLLSITSCKREERQLRPDPNASQTLNTVQVSGLNPGANSISSPPPAGQYEESAYAVSQGKTLTTSTTVWVVMRTAVAVSAPR